MSGVVLGATLQTCPNGRTPADLLKTSFLCFNRGNDFVADCDYPGEQQEASDTKAVGRKIRTPVCDAYSNMPGEKECD